ncbi:MAG TPA: TIGR00730 family Rossman fold protein [Bacteroides sp.]|nr:TIGR00730 family Rossman fold protein [Bacteroides sp.]
MIHRRVSVFCASSAKVNGNYLEAAAELGQILSNAGIAANYGGGALGLMGALADSMLSAGGSIRGIIPKFMVEQGWNHKKVEDMLIVADMHERKKTLTENIDAFITLPGGVGTLEELLEMITLKQLGQVLVPIIIVNTDNFFDPFLEMLERMIEEQFMRPVHKNIWTVVETPGDVLEAIRNAPEWDGSAIKYAPA